MTLNIYRIIYTKSSRNDVKAIKKYIVETFKYKELGQNFTKKVKAAIKELKKLPTSNTSIGFQYRGYDIYLKIYRTYLFFYVFDKTKKEVTLLRVLQDGMNWQFIIKEWLNQQ